MGSGLSKALQLFSSLKMCPSTPTSDPQQTLLLRYVDQELLIGSDLRLQTLPPPPPPHTRSKAGHFSRSDSSVPSACLIEGIFDGQKGLPQATQPGSLLFLNWECVLLFIHSARQAQLPIGFCVNRPSLWTRGPVKPSWDNLPHKIAVLTLPCDHLFLCSAQGTWV